ncbi:hypothetical protein B0F87_102153 [Methylobacter tundripaludum]|uniref:RapA2 cadherin-like domain-containing protein n=1 Tax=Methylobacter tundripaludum TaxID=173365 RepID=A0A2S6HHU4_9GAMM|nr:hypothetical protein [Methylobacter tundripaludum]PPK77047.1 hypothetical protein B0F87_102153 [Methylobacter tundripaludum]
MKTKHTLAAIALTALSLSVHADLARVGPTDLPSPAGHGFPNWYQDLNGTVLDLCLPNASDTGALQQNACLLVGPGLPDPPYSFPTNFPDEAFYFNATSVMDMPAGKKATLVLALEAAFSVGPVVVGDQITFTRIRLFAGVPEPGIYTVTHPYGVETFPVDAVSATGNRDIVFSEDVGVARGVFDGARHSRIGPFLQRSASSGGAPLAPVTLNGAQFLSDGVATEFVTGSPFGTNYLEICGETAAGAPIILGDQGISGTCIRTDQFSLMGRLHDFVASPIPSPLEIYNGFYKRDAAGTQVDVYARDIKVLASQPNPSLTAAATNIAPVKMIPFGPAALGQYYTQGMVDPLGDLPGPISVINSADTPPSLFTKHVVDIVTAASVNYANQTLAVVATSSDKGGFGVDQLPPTLTLEGYGDTAVSTNNANDPAEVTLTVSGVVTPPDTVTVKSTAGGSGTFTVARNQVTGTSVPGAGVPLALDDGAAAEAGGAAVDIPVTANDVVNPAALITSVQLVGQAIPAGSGSASVNGTAITYTPGSVNSDATFQYTASNSVGQSNVATVTVTVAASAAGPAPIVNPDGPVTVAVSQSVVIDVLANDSGNGGTLNPASVLVSNVTGGTATADATGKVTFAAGATAGAFGFDYTVTNDNGQVSPLARVTVTVVNAENIQITSTQCKPINATSGEWRVAGTSTVQTNNNIQLYLTASVPADLNTNKLGAAAPVVAGAWDFRAKPGPACKTPISLRSSATGATRANIAITIR